MAETKQNMYVDKIEASAKPVVIQKVMASSSIFPTADIRGPFSRSDYESFRPNEAIPKDIKTSIKLCRNAYFRISVVRQVIDLMTNFCCDGLRIEHQNPKVEVFFNAWFNKLRMKEVSEEFARHAFIDYNVIVKKMTARLTQPIEKEWIGAEVDVKLNVERNKNLTREIPVKYIFLDPVNAEWSIKNPAIFYGMNQLKYKLDSETVSLIRNNPQLSKNLPEDFRQISSSAYFNLDMSKIHVAFNKKDSWDSWATPMLVSVLPDIFYKDKLKLADLAALDGLINVIRLWKLGDHNKEIFPGELSFSKLTEALQSHTGGGAIDIVWDSMIDMKEYYPPVEKILGSEKYTQVNQDILIGLGVPDVLLGGKGANFSNSFIQLKTIIERLQSVREMIIDWLQPDLKLICDSFDISVPPKITFSNMNLYDENVSKQLMIQLFDRGVLSDQSLLEQFDRDIDIENARIKKQDQYLSKESKDRKGPFSRNQNVSPNANGRPVNTKDATRKTRVAKPKVSASDFIDKLAFVEAVFATTAKVYISSNGIDNLRKLTASQKDFLDKTNMLVISCINSIDELTEAKISDIITNPTNYPINQSLVARIEQEKQNIFESKNEPPTIDQLKNICAIELMKG